MQLDGIKYRNHFLKIRRPVDYEKNAKVQPERPIPKLNLARLGIVSSQVEDSDLKLYVGGLSLNMNEEQIKKVLMRYGQLKSFRLVKEKDEIISKGYAF
jgi:RNA recognition motif-containing protein